MENKARVLSDPRLNSDEVETMRAAFDADDRINSGSGTSEDMDTARKGGELLKEKGIPFNQDTQFDVAHNQTMLTQEEAQFQKMLRSMYGDEDEDDDGSQGFRFKLG